MARDTATLKAIAECIDSASMSRTALWVNNEDVGMALAKARSITGENFPNIEVFTHKDTDSPDRVALRFMHE